MVGRAHVGLFKIIKELQNEQHQIESNIESILQGVPRPKKRKHDRKHENRVQVVYNDRENRPVLDFLRGMAYNISF